jgi:hypothetical protein
LHGTRLAFDVVDMVRTWLECRFDTKLNDFVIDKVKVMMQKETMVTELPGQDRLLDIAFTWMSCWTDTDSKCVYNPGYKKLQSKNWIVLGIVEQHW